MRKGRFLYPQGFLALVGIACVAPPTRDAPERPASETSASTVPETTAPPAPEDSLFNAYVRSATESLRNGDPASAILAFEQALAIEPENRDVLILRAHAALLEAWRNETRGGPSSELRVHENPTEHVPAGSSREEERPLSLRVTEATPGPAELIVQILPLTVKPGDPYVLRVRIFNEQNKTLAVKSLEVVSTFGAKSLGKGQAIEPLARVIHPRDVTVLMETRGTWTEDMNHGSIEVTVGLVDGAKLTKKVSW